MSAAQSLNASVPITVTLNGIYILFSSARPLNAFAGISVPPFKVTFLSELFFIEETCDAETVAVSIAHPANAEVAID